MLDRRQLITGLISLVAAPAIVRAGSLMPVKSIWPKTYTTTYHIDCLGDASIDRIAILSVGTDFGDGHTLIEHFMKQGNDGDFVPYEQHHRYNGEAGLTIGFPVIVRQPAVGPFTISKVRDCPC